MLEALITKEETEEEAHDRDILRTYGIMRFQLLRELEHDLSDRNCYLKPVNKIKERKLKKRTTLLDNFYFSRENPYERILDALRKIFGEGRRDPALCFELEKTQKKSYKLRIKSYLSNGKELYDIIRSKFNRVFIDPRPEIEIVEIPKYKIPERVC